MAMIRFFFPYLIQGFPALSKRTDFPSHGGPSRRCHGWIRRSGDLNARRGDAHGLRRRLRVPERIRWIRWIRWSCGWVAEDFRSTTGSTTVFGVFGISKVRLGSVFSDSKTEMVEFGWQPIRLELARGIKNPLWHPGAVYPTRCKQAFRCSLQAHALTYPGGVNEIYL